MRIQFQQILCTTDLSDYSIHGIRYGAALARTLDAKLYICSIIDPIPLVYAESFGDPVIYEEKMKKKAKDKIQTFMENSNIEWEAVIRVGHPSTRITELADELNIDLAIVTTRPGSGLKKFFMGSTSEELIRTLKIPLLVLRDIEPEALVDAETEPRLNLENILIGYDFSYHSSLALRYALSLAQEFQAKLHIVHVVPESQAKALKQEKFTNESIKQQKSAMQQLKEKLEKLIPEECADWCQYNVQIVLGNPYQELRKYAMANSIDLSIIGSRGVSLAESMLMGSVTDRLIRENSCPVMSVH